ncbi:MAG: SixA phosphatase family protein [Capsulimonadaceae bacterium]
MKTLIIVRHAKAQPDSPEGDFGRKLAPRGQADAKYAARCIHRGLTDGIGTLPPPRFIELIITSDAARALETANIVAATVPHEALMTEHAIYDASLDDLLDVIRGLPDEANTVLLVGHNPGLSEVLYHLATDKRTADDLKTAAAAFTELNIDSWTDFGESTGRIVAVYSR